jgi:hypothetical protein
VNTTGFMKYAGVVAALALCSACAALQQAQGDMGAPSAAAPSYRYVGKTLSVNGRLVTAARLSPVPRYTSFAADARAKGKKFEYFFPGIFDYPKSEKQIGQINTAGGQGCTNVLYGYGKKYFWIVASQTAIDEYEVLKKPVKSLSESVGAPSSCAMDSSGDLAVGILDGAGAGDVVIYKNASGSGTVYTTPLAEEFFDGYDNQGNLFADGFSASSGNFALVELPKGSSTFEAIATSNAVAFPGSVQWDGTYVTVLDQLDNAMYRYAVSGTKATLKGTVSLSDSGDCAQSWIVTGLVYCADAGNDDGEAFKYPAGGSPVATFTSSSNLLLGVTAAER